MPADESFSNINSLWGAFAAEALSRCGLTSAVISPGSRSTPLAYAFAIHERIDCRPALDERSAGFLALGMAKRTGRPVALICTSGTAVANYFPAVIEARESRVPLLVFTADRPPELRDCASGQTIDQVGIFHRYPNWQMDMPLPEAEPGLFRYLRQTLVLAWERAHWPAGGPVHLNFPFRDPLPPVPTENGTRCRVMESVFTLLDDLTAPEPPVPVPGRRDVTLLRNAVTEERGLIIAGAFQGGDIERHTRDVAELARRTSWPVLVDALSPLRFQSSRIPGLVTGYDAVLRNRDLAARLLPKIVLQLGALPTSKVLRSWLEAAEGIRFFVSDASERNLHPLHGKAQSLRFGPGALLSVMGDMLERIRGGFAEAWKQADNRAIAFLQKRMDACEELFEGKAAYLLSKHLPGGTPLFLASSMPVRDFEFFAARGDTGLLPFGNRGANGIDGTLSTALGLVADGGRGALLCGDLAFLHDSNGLLHLPEIRGSLTVYLINNEGGGIFETLPVSAFSSVFERFFATPQQVDFSQLLRAYGVACEQVNDWRELAQSAAALPENGLRVLELRTDRKQDAITRRNWLEEAAEAADF